MDLSSQLPKGISHYTVDNVEGFDSLYPILLIPLDTINRYYTHWIIISMGFVITHPVDCDWCATLSNSSCRSISNSSNNIDNDNDDDNNHNNNNNNNNNNN